jgi:DNA-binding NtrC family response regulator
MNAADRKNHVKILVVDDEEDVRQLIALILKAEGYDVTTAGDSMSALSQSLANHFALATLDIRMPGMSGAEALDALLKLSPQTAVIIISGYVTAPEADELRGRGAYAVLHKPFSIEELLWLVREALGKEMESSRL